MFNITGKESAMLSKTLLYWLGGMIIAILVIAIPQSTGKSVEAGDPIPTKPANLEERAKAAATVPAFPGAEGFGAQSVGGRGGRVIEVTNLNDDGPGSFRTAIEAEGPRTVVFRVAGIIELKTPLEITQPFITIAGQTAPGGGITLKNHPSVNDSALIVHTHDVIIRYMTSRPGPTSEKVSGSNAIEIAGTDVYNVIIDHCSLSWAVDEVACTWYEAHDITIQWSIIAEGLHCSTHEEGCHSMGLLIGSDGSRDISVHHNLFAHNHERNPCVKTSGLVDIVNNVIYNSWGTPTVVVDDFGQVPVNCVGNYVKGGVDSNPDKYFITVVGTSGLGAEIFIRGNITPLRPRDDLDEWSVVKPVARQWIVPIRHNAPLVTTASAFEAYDQVLANAGATIGLDSRGNKYWRRDVVDERIVNDVRNGTGRIIDDPSEVGGWPILAAGTPPTDTDHDGMPDAWEDQYGLNPSAPSDSPLDADRDGYTNVEEYLNGTDPLSNDTGILLLYIYLPIVFK